VYQNIRKFIQTLQHRYVEMTSYHSDVIRNAAYRQRRTFNKSFSREKNM